MNNTFKIMKGIEKTNQTIWNRKSLVTDNSYNKADSVKLDESQREFLYTMMIQNLEYARHVENERITFNSIYSALVVGVLAFALTTKDYFWIKTAGLTMLIVIGVIACLLTYRWNNVFNRHVFYSPKCYLLLHKSIFPISEGEEYVKEEQKKDGNEETANTVKTTEIVDKEELFPDYSEAPAYCFEPKDPVTDESCWFFRFMRKYVKTQTLFNVLNFLIVCATILGFFFLVA